MSRRQMAFFGLAGLATFAAMTIQLVGPAAAQSARRGPAAVSPSQDPRQPAPPFKSGNALEARSAYVRAMNKARDDYRQHILKAKRVYRDSLNEAKQAAMKTGNLDEANAVQAELKIVDTEIAAIPNLPPPDIAPELVIRRARYGADQRQEDITRSLNAQIQDGRIDNVPVVPDPAPGTIKSVVIEGTYGGVDFVLAFPESFPLHHLRFGRPTNPTDPPTDR